MAVTITEPPGSPRAPDVLKWRPPQRLRVALAPGTVIPANDTNGVVVNVAGSGRIRVIVLTSAAGTLRLRWRLADQKTNATSVGANPPDTAIVGGTELSVDIAPTSNFGHAYLEVAIVNGGPPSTVTYLDVLQAALRGT
jgi:hypothetical protein